MIYSVKAKPRSPSLKLFRQVFPLVFVLSLGANLLLWSLYERQVQTTDALAESIAQTDIPFLQHMLIHHRQAVLIAQLSLDKLEGRPKWIATSVLTKQAEEIGVMRGLLASWEKKPIPDSVNMDWMRPHATPEQLAYVDRCATVPGGMEGLATPEQLQALAQTLDAQQVRDQFVELMLPHHLAALPMLDYARKYSGSETVRTLAGAMLADQRKEIIELQNMQPKG